MRMSDRSVVDLGRPCDLRCEHCYYRFVGGERRWKDLDDLRAELWAIRDAGRKYIDVTGGEPTLHLLLPEVLAEAEACGLKPRVITHGLRLVERFDELISAGLHDLLFSLNGPREIHDASVRKVGAFERATAAMRLMGKGGFSYCANAVVTSRTAPGLVELADILCDLPGLRMVNFIDFNPYYAWAGEQKKEAWRLQARYREYVPAVREAARLFRDYGISFTLRYVPYCVAPGLEKHVVNILGNRHDPYEWRGPREQDEAEVLRGLRTAANDKCEFGPPCAGCGARAICDGVNKVYLERFGWDEFTPVATGEPAKDVLHFRGGYAPAFEMKDGAFDLEGG